MSLDPAEIKSIVAALQESDWDEAEVVVGDVRIAVARNGASLTAAPTPAAPVTTAQATDTAQAATPQGSPVPAGPPSAPPLAEPAPDAAGWFMVTATTVGVFWQAPEPGAEPFVKVGDHVQEGDILCIVEVMKLMNNVTADTSGIITQVHVANGEGVEFGTPLFTIQPGD